MSALESAVKPVERGRTGNPSDSAAVAATGLVDRRRGPRRQGGYWANLLTLDGEEGWIWAEATGGNNPLGWMPDQYMRVDLAAKELKNIGLPDPAPQTKPVVEVTRGQGAGFSLPVPPFWLIMIILWLISRAGRRRRAASW